MEIREKTFRSWMQANFTKQELLCMRNVGVDKGWHGLSDYNETFALYSRFKQEILNLVDNDDRIDNEIDLAFISRSYRSRQFSTDFDFENFMTWYGAERIAKELTEGGL